MRNRIVLLMTLVFLSSSVAVKAETQDRELFDNMGMDMFLRDAEKYADDNQYDKSKEKWSKVIQFMHSPGWFPTAALVPICLKFAHLADRNLARNEYADAENLLKASYEFPFHKPGEEVQMDAVTAKMIDHFKKNNQTDQCKQFLQFVVSKTVGQRQAGYKAKLEELTHPIAHEVTQEVTQEVSHEANPEAQIDAKKIQQHP